MAEAQQLSYEELARSSGADDDEIEEHYEEVKEKFGHYLDDEEHVWWQVCNRLGIECESPAEREGTSGEAKDFSIADIELIDDTENINIGGYVYQKRIFEADPENDRPEAIRLGLADETGTTYVRAKKPEVRAKWHDQDIGEGDYLELEGAFAAAWETDDNDKRVSVHVTEYTEWNHEDSVDPFEVLPSASEEALETGQPCAVRGFCLGGDEITWRRCPNCYTGWKEDDGCKCNTPPPKDETSEEFNTIIQVSDSDGMYEFFVDGHDLGLEGSEITVVGTKSDDGINVLGYTAERDEGAPPEDEIDNKRAKDGITRTLKSFERMPRDVVEKKLREDYFDGDDDKAEDFIEEKLIGEGLVEEKGDDLVWLGRGS